MKIMTNNPKKIIGLEGYGLEIVCRENLNIEPNLVLVDGLYKPKIEVECESIIKGDSKVEQISAASIIAKVARDFEMDFLHDKFKMYNFKQNNGYGTRQHLEAIESLGKTIYHRESFIKQI